MATHRSLSGVPALRKCSYASIEQTMRRFREYLGIKQDSAIDALQLFESLDRLKVTTLARKKVSLGYGVRDLEATEGYSIYDSQREVIEVLASESTYQLLESGHPRAAFFVCHEVGHCVLHTDELVQLAQLPTSQQAAFHRGKVPHDACADTEWQANAFAGALLMPAVALQELEEKTGLLDAESVAERFGVSPEAASYRIDNFQRRRRGLLP